MEYVGRKVKKEFKGHGTFFGSVESYDASTGFCKIVYEDGDSEELDLTETSSLLVSTEGLESAREAPPTSVEEPTRRLARKRRKRSHMNTGKIGISVIESGVSGNSGEMGLNAVGLDLNEGLDLNDDGFNNLNDDYGGNLADNSDGGGAKLKGVDLNEAVDLESRDDGMDFSERVSVDRLGKRKETIDLNLDVNEDSENFSPEEKRVCFDLNLGLSENEIKNSENFLGQFEQNEKLCAEEEKQDREEIGGETKGILFNVKAENGNVNMNLEKMGVSAENCAGRADYENEVPVSAPRGRRGRKRREISDNNANFVVPEMVNLDGENGNVNINSKNHNETARESGSDVLDYDSQVPGSLPGGRRGRKRKNVSDNNITSATPETGLRRSNRRVKRDSFSGQDHIINTAGLDGVTDQVSSPAISSCEEKIKVLGCEKSEDNVLPPKVDLPPSSGGLDLNGVPAFNILSVYAFLRSFSISLFLRPFELDGFVASVKCNYSTLLFDSIHVSLLQTLRKHLELLSNEGDLSASNCLRSLNWDLLDLITWPMFVVEYLLLYSSDYVPGFDLCHLKLSQSDYYKLPASTKIEILLRLCDDAMEVEPIRSEINRRTLATERQVDLDRTTKCDSSKKRKAALDVASSSCITEEDVEETADWNSDECCLCKMDGNLICCDGCPAAFHSRCVGVVSSLLPEGDWYCPECAINKDKPWMKMEKSIRGAELLGMDPYRRLYYSSCGYLLVSELLNDEYSFRYYHKNDLPTLIDALESSPFVYGKIITAISKHWNVTHGNDGSKTDLDARSFSVHSLFPIKAPLPHMHPTPLEAHIKDVAAERKSEEKSFFSTYPSNIEPEVPDCVNMMLETDNHGSKMENRLASSEGSAEVSQAATNTFNIKESGQDCSERGTGILSYDSEIPLKVVNAGDHYLTSTILEVEQRTNLISANHGHAPSIINPCGIMPHVHCGETYVNFYEFAWTASSVVEALMRKSSDKTSEKIIRSEEEVIAGQLKVISGKSAYLCWPNIQNLIANSRKEKCGWCFTCQGPEEERDCLFIMNENGPAVESFNSEVLGIQSISNSKSHLIDVMCHIICTEDRLQGLLLGPWLDPYYSELWRKSVLGVSDITSLKGFLLKLESNLHLRALSADWLKYVDSVPTMGSASHIVRNSVRASTKHGVGRKRARFLELDTTSSSSSANGLSLFWWRGGRVSRQLFNWKVLPRSLASKAARQGGFKKILGILYPDSGEYAKRSKCVAWRASVETSRSVEQLALQVRELDANIRWDDIGNPNLLSKTDKESKKSAKLFKKVIIRRKCSEGSVVKYLLDFGKRRFIPDIVVIHGSKLEDTSSERKKYWLEESHVPLHLLKMFEERRIARKTNKTCSGKLRESTVKTNKPFKEKGFSYLFSRAERLENSQCGHCNKDVLIREAVSCQYCKGFFHKRHARKSAGSIIAQCTYTCHKCLDEKSVEMDTKKGKSGTPKSKKASKLLKPLGSRKGKKLGKYKQQVQLQKNKKVQLVPLRRSTRHAKPVVKTSLLDTKIKRQKKRKQAKSKKDKMKKPDKLKKPKNGSWQKKRTPVNYSYWLNGLRFSRRLNDERVMHFRSKFLLVLSGQSTSIACMPKCSLCGELEFKSELNYVSCEICGDWFHGDAFDLKADKVEKLIGFKCHMCRNKNPPVCPQVCATESSKAALSKEINVGPECMGKESIVPSLLDETFTDQKSQPNEESNEVFLIGDEHEKQSSVPITGK